MSFQEALAALRYLPDDTQLTFSVRAGDLRRALEQAEGGPGVLTCEQAAELLGYTADQWRRWAKAGKIAGAWQDADGAPWRLPKEGCEAHIRAQQARGRRAPDPAGVPAGRPPRRVARGPRSAARSTAPAVVRPITAGRKLGPRAPHAAGAKA